MEGSRSPSQGRAAAARESLESGELFFGTFARRVGTPKPAQPVLLAEAPLVEAATAPERARHAWAHALEERLREQAEARRRQMEAQQQAAAEAARLAREAAEAERQRMREAAEAERQRLREAAEAEVARRAGAAREALASERARLRAEAEKAADEEFLRFCAERRRTDEARRRDASQGAEVPRADVPRAEVPRAEVPRAVATNVESGEVFFGTGTRALKRPRAPKPPA